MYHLLYLDNSIYSSLALEMVRAITHTKRVVSIMIWNGVSNIALNELKIQDRYGRILVNYRGQQKF